MEHTLFQRFAGFICPGCNIFVYLGDEAFPLFLLVVLGYAAVVFDLEHPA